MATKKPPTAAKRGGKAKKAKPPESKPMRPTKLPKLEKLGENFHKLTIDDLEVWFSYETPIAFKFDDSHLVAIRENEWGATTGKHLRAVKDAMEAIHRRCREGMSETGFEHSWQYQLGESFLGPKDDDPDPTF